MWVSSYFRNKIRRSRLRLLVSHSIQASAELDEELWMEFCHLLSRDECWDREQSIDF